MDNLDIISKKMIFIYNALENGWSIKKRENTFIFTKKHEGKKEVFSNEYLLTFMKENLSTKELLK
tara:strand:- start:45 stop:239 length:195 start_codon:yes stop_codon:yes gene_type:complete